MMPGLWFEYVWDSQVDDGLGYYCSMWTVLTDADDSQVAYNYMHMSEDNQKFAKLGIAWQGDSAVAKIDRIAAVTEEAQKLPTDFHVVYTDYATHLVGQVCRNLEGDKHSIDTTVWTREKQPSMFISNKLRNYLVAQGHDVEGMTKSRLVDCWGEDKMS